MKAVARDLLGKGLVYGLGSSLNGLVGFVLLPFIIHYLTPAEYGRYAIAEMIVNFLLVFLGLGMNVALLARYPKLEAAERRPFVSSVFGFMLLTTAAIQGVFALFVVLAGRRLFPYLTFEDYALIGAISAAETIWLLFATLFRAEQSAWKFIATSITQVSLALVITVVLIARFGLRESGLLYGRLCADVLVLLVLAPQFVRFPPKFKVAPAVKLSRIGIPLIPATFASMWVVMSPRFFLERLGDPSVVGSYAIDSKLAGMVSLLFVQPFGMVWVAALSHIARRDDAKAIYSRVITYYTLLGGLAALVIGLLAPFIAGLLGKQDFPLSPGVIMLLAVANVCSGLMYPLTIGPYVCEKTGRMVPVFFAAMVLSIVIGWPFVWMWSMTGAALALVVVYLLQGVALGWVSHKLYPVKIEWTRLVCVIAALGGSYAVTRQLVGANAPWWAPAILLGLAIPVLFVTRVLVLDELLFWRNDRR
jgi:O-antigen/teichoic acid export membrane protein